MIRFIIIFLSLIFSSLSFSQNIIENYDFENGLTDWSSYFSSGYNGTLIQSSIEHSGNYSARINITQVPSSPQVLGAQIKTNKFHIESGHDYHLSLWLKADQNVDVQVILIKNSSPWTWLASNTVSLNTTYQHFDLLENNAPFSTDDDVRLAIRCGNKVAKIYIDDVVLTDCTTPSNYSSLHSSVTGKGRIQISNNNSINECIQSCNDEFVTNSSLILTAIPEPGYTFSGWSGACNGLGNCQVSLSQAKYVGAHFTLNGTDNSCLDYRNKANWSIAGYDGNIPKEGNIIDMTQPPYNCVGDGTYNNYFAMLDVLNDVKNIPGFNIIYFPSGTYFFQGYKSFDIPNNTVIRGECSLNTILNIDATEVITPNYTKNHIFRMYKWNSGTDGYKKLMGGYHKESNKLIIDDPTGFSIGNIIELRRDNDTNKMSTNLVPIQLSQATFSNAYNNWGANSVGEIFKIKSINGNEITVDRKLNFTYNPKLNPRLKVLNVIENAGIENLKIHRPTQKDNYNIQIEGCYNCWVRNIESSYTQKAHINLARSYHIEIKDNYFHHSYDYGGGGHGYGVAVNHRTTSSLIENNIFNTLRHAMVLSYGPNGNTFGYNFSRESWDNSANFGLGDQKADISLHGFYPLMNLFEGNVVEYIHSSDWWGPSGPGNTFFRNRASKEELIISDNSDYQNVIANELTFNPIGWADNFNIHSSVDHTTKHSNNDLGDIDVNKINTLPISLYKNNIPNFCNGFPYPQIGPVSYISNNNNYPYNRSLNPAQFRYESSNQNASCFENCSLNTGLLDDYSICDSTISISLNEENEYKRLYGFSIYNLPNNYGNEVPDIYIKLYENGTLIQNTSSSVIESDPDIYVKISSIILNGSSTYEVKVYDKDLTFDDYIGNITFSGSTNSYNAVNGSLEIYLDKFTYNTSFLWSDGTTSNPKIFDQSGTYFLEVTQSNGCTFIDTVSINLSNPNNINGLHTWNGSIDSDWFSKCNWNNNHVPNINNDVLIPTGSINNPIINNIGFVDGEDMNGDGNIDINDRIPGKAFCRTMELEDGTEIEIKVTDGAVLEIQQ
ncbi:MAG: hypothetical protein CL846_09680 [Crocinitomicaceae bacterium]|nr:hypothetical protein [Crocinitomicaceae bacterium]